jgi:hypothetical protein
MREQQQKPETYGKANNVIMKSQEALQSQNGTFSTRDSADNADELSSLFQQDDESDDADDSLPNDEELLSDDVMPDGISFMGRFDSVVVQVRDTRPQHKETTTLASTDDDHEFHDEDYHEDDHEDDVNGNGNGADSGSDYCMRTAGVFA